MKKSFSLSKKHLLYMTLLFPVAGLLLFTGCSSIDGTANREPATNRAAAFFEQNPIQSQADDSDDAPDSEWFY